MKKHLLAGVSLLLFVTGCLVSIGFSYYNPVNTKELLTKANENPLNCAYFIANKLNTGSKRIIFKQIAINFSKIGNYSLAYEIAKSSTAKSDGTQLPALLEIAWGYANSGLNEKANELLAEISSSFGPSTEVAVIYSSIGQRTLSKEILAKVFERIKNLPKDDTDYRELKLIDIVSSYARIGEYNEAIKVANVITKPYNSSALKEIALEYANNKQFDKALQIVPKIESYSSKTSLLINLAEKFLEDKQNDKAIDLIDQAYQSSLRLDAGYGKIFYMTNIASLYGKVGQKDKALEILTLSLEIANTIKNSNTKDSSLRDIAVVYGTIDEYEKALQVIQSVKFPMEKVYSLTRISTAYIKANEKIKALTTLSDAFQIAIAMKDNVDDKDNALLEVSIKYGEAGEFLDALKAVQLISGDYRKAQALADIGLAYIKAGKELENVSNILDNILNDSKISSNGK